MFDNNTDSLHRRLSSWRRSAGVVESSSDTGAVREHMRSQNSVLRTLLLDTVEEIDTTLYALNDYLDQGDRSIVHEQRLDERSASALYTYERAVARVLEQGISNALQDLPREREVIRTVYLSPPPPKPWWKRIFGG
jgi:hypothetical protein